MVQHQPTTIPVKFLEFHEFLPDLSVQHFVGENNQPFVLFQKLFFHPVVVAWRWSSGLITELSLSWWINPRLGHARLYGTNGPALLYIVGSRGASQLGGIF